MILRCVIIVSIISLASGKNAFDATRGCEQYDSSQGYDYPHPYYPISSFHNVNATTDGTVRIRLGIYANSDGHIRLAPKKFPYNGTTMDEIVIFTASEKHSFVRRYRRQDASNWEDVDVLASITSEVVLSPFKPLMFTIAIHSDGLVQLTKDDEAVPFLQFTDSQNTFKFISFCNFQTPAVYFFDCPLEH